MIKVTSFNVGDVGRKITPENENGMVNTHIVRKPSFAVRFDIDHSITEKSFPERSRHLRERKKSWKLIDGEVEDIQWSSNDGCRKWIKRLLTIGNILAIATSICILFSVSYLCFTRYVTLSEYM